MYVVQDGDKNTVVTFLCTMCRIHYQVLILFEGAEALESPLNRHRTTSSVVSISPHCMNIH